MADDGDASTVAGDGVGGSGRFHLRRETLRRLAAEFMTWRRENGYKVGDLATQVAPHVARQIDKIHSSPAAKRLRGTKIGGKVAAQFAEGGAADKAAKFIADKTRGWSENYKRPDGVEPQVTAKWPGRVAAGTAAASLFGYAVHRRNARRREEEALAAQLEQMDQAAYRPQAADPRLATTGAGRGGSRVGL